MRYNRPRRDKFRNNDRGFRRNGFRDSKINSINHVPNSLHRRPFNRDGNNPEKLLEKYNTLAKEASTKGDKTLSENYYQHADHFARILHEKVINQKQNSSQNEGLKVAEANPSENTFVKPNQITEEKK